ncbi:ERF superfamily protein [Dyella jiangningensis]|uniref:ERF family protein n=1 Tax=Dyella sp. AtDHG13 TaxID=1938897 RepID=UPI000880C0CD|nr:ERF family protein [Dyella sp. AtDHG13]PXV54189.1 ERF superfamily protein [Dyella sp. AtDHG13]SDL04794.1 ERF superfamily protein [Dyella jiangningensis]
MNAVVKVDQLPQAQPDTTTLLAVISRAAADPNTDVDKMERLMAMYERIEAKKAEAEFSADMAQMQAELPSVTERGDANGRYRFALWEDINAAIKPILTKYGFALSFRTDFSNGIGVTGVLSHRSGHKVDTQIILPADKSGNKPDVQAVASSVSYGKRYTASALLNLTSHGEDDDAFRASAPFDNSQEWIEKANNCQSAEELQDLWKSGGQALREAGNNAGYARLKSAVTARLDYIRSAPTQVDEEQQA